MTRTTTSPAPTPESTDGAPDVTSPDDDDPEGTSVLPWRDYTNPDQLSDPDSAEILSIWEVGPAALSGTAVEDSEVTTLNGANAVKVVLAEGADGLDAFNAMAESCYNSITGANVSSPEEAVAWQLEQDATSPKPTTINVYESDGSTVVGSFLVFGSG